MAAVVQVQQLVLVALKPAYRDRLLRAHAADAPVRLQLIQLIHQGVVAQLLGQHIGQKQRLIAVKVVVQVHHLLAGHRLAEALLPRRDDNDLFKALVQRPVQRDRAGASAVEVRLAIQHDRHGCQRQAGRRAHGLVERKIRLSLLKVGGLAGLDVRRHRKDPHTAVGEGLLVEGHFLFDVVQHKFQAEQAAAAQCRLGAEVPAVVAVAQVDAGGPPRLVGRIVQCVQ